MSQSTIASTTDSQEQVDRAANYDVEVGHDESPVTEGPHVTITLSNSPADVDQASYDYRDDAPHARDGRSPSRQRKSRSLYSRPLTLKRWSARSRPSYVNTRKLRAGTTPITQGRVKVKNPNYWGSHEFSIVPAPHRWTRCGFEQRHRAMFHRWQDRRRLPEPALPDSI